MKPECIASRQSMLPQGYERHARASSGGKGRCAVVVSNTWRLCSFEVVYMVKNGAAWLISQKDNRHGVVLMGRMNQNEIHLKEAGTRR